eukprot:CAMPEP_0178535506 /NCGR_PEP_ID=MMETSP0696-20121128/35579_1 /TAXON_ID=265572 /ORGANISM="Extubocellulus spinifer, Strain CCMP396" /LENGTH=341 /DNA_ID=CAMNT_0020167645 /DNA_START=37 /DNA_END=1062 /DNA_ORIENTATION=-
MGWFDRWRNNNRDGDTQEKEGGKEKDGWSDRLQRNIATKINETVDIPILSESQEQKIAENLVDFDRLKPSSWIASGTSSSSTDGDKGSYKDWSTTTLTWVGDYVTSTIPPEARRFKLDEISDLTPTQTAFLVTCSTASLVIGYKLGRTNMPWTLYAAVADIPSTYFGPNAPLLRGRVVSVSDGDTVRFLSAPTIFHTSRLQDGQKMSRVALPIRICTIDTPETAKFGKPGQPFGEEAKTRLSDLVDDRIVRIRLLQKDQYGRAVAEVRSGFFPPFYKYMDEQMLKAGLAEVYQGSGAVYGYKGKDAYLRMQEEAKASKEGMWSQKDRESAAEFKARLKAEG